MGKMLSGASRDDSVRASGDVELEEARWRMMISSVHRVKLSPRPPAHHPILWCPTSLLCCVCNILSSLHSALPSLLKPDIFFIVVFFFVFHLFFTDMALTHLSLSHRLHSLPRACFTVSTPLICFPRRLSPSFHPSLQPRHPPVVLLSQFHHPSTFFHSSKHDNFIADNLASDDRSQGDGSNPQPPVPDPKQEWPILEQWNVPWDGTTTLVGMMSWLFSFLLTGLAVSVGAAQFGIGRREVLDLDEQATFILIHQLAETVAGLGAISLVLRRYKPLPPQLFSYDFSRPFDLRRGWILYGGLGVVAATVSVVAASTLVVNLKGQPPPREEADALLQLLPIIGASSTSTISLIIVTGVLAPLLEETVFRGFLMTSLTKWYEWSFSDTIRIPTPVAIAISACAFAGAHLTPGEFPQLVALGIVLGLAYAQTRTLITPMLIHSLWNSGVIILLTILRLQGYDIKELL